MNVKLSKMQQDAIIQMARNNGNSNSFQIAGRTGSSLVDKGLATRSFVPDGIGETTTYTLTEQGWLTATAIRAIENGWLIT
jgi:hypothetical protein